MSKGKGWTEVSKKQLQNSVLYCVGKTNLVEVDLDAVETQVQKIDESDANYSEGEFIVPFDHEKKSAEINVGAGESEGCRNDLALSKLRFETDKRLLRTWMSNTTTVISEGVKKLALVQRQILESVSRAKKAKYEDENDNKLRVLDLQAMADIGTKNVRNCYLEFSEMPCSPTSALVALDPFVISKALDVMKDMNTIDWDRVKQLYDMFSRAGKIDQLVLYEFAIKVIVSTRGKNGVVDVLKGIDGDIAEAAFRFGKTLLCLFHGSYLLTKDIEPTKEPLTVKINTGAQIPESVRRSFDKPKTATKNKHKSYAYILNSNTQVTKHCDTCKSKKKPVIRTRTSNIKSKNPKYAHVKSRYKEAAANYVLKIPKTPDLKKTETKIKIVSKYRNVNKKFFSVEMSPTMIKPPPNTPNDQFTPKETNLSKILLMTPSPVGKTDNSSTDGSVDHEPRVVRIKEAVDIKNINNFVSKMFEPPLSNSNEMETDSSTDDEVPSPPPASSQSSFEDTLDTFTSDPMSDDTYVSKTNSILSIYRDPTPGYINE